MIPGGVLPYVGYIGMCSLKGYGLAALIINRVTNFWSGHKYGRENHRFWS